MQTSAKTKAKEFMKTWDTSCDYEALLNSLTKLLVEHERDTKYTAIDILNSMEDEGTAEQEQLIERDEAIFLIHNCPVGLS